MERLPLFYLIAPFCIVFYCELKFFEINMNTGNFHLACNDATVQEYYGAFPIRRIYNSKMSTFKSSFGRGWSFQYTDDKAGKTTYTYDNNDNILSMSSENYGTCYLTYDAAGSQDSLIDEHGMKTIIERDSMYRITAQINPDGSRTEFGYDELGNLLSVSTPDGNTITYTYDYRTNQISGVTDSQGNVQETEYDIAGRPLRQTYRDGTFVELKYNDMGRVISFTDTNGKKTIYSYNAAGYELSSWWASKNASAPYIYDANGQRIIVNKDGTIDSPNEYATVTTGKRPGM